MLFSSLIRFSSKEVTAQQSGSLTRTSNKSSNSLCSEPGVETDLTICLCGLGNSLKLRQHGTPTLFNKDHNSGGSNMLRDRLCAPQM